MASSASKPGRTHSRPRRGPYNDRIFSLSEDGDCFVAEHGRDYRLVRKNSIGELCMSTPAISQGSLLLRTAQNLYRIGG